MKQSDKGGGKYAYEGLDRLMHEKARLSIMASLYIRREGHNFNELKKLCSLTDGNLSRHLSILKEAGLIGITKGFEKNKPYTVCRLTENGRLRFQSYLSELEQIISDAAAAEKFSDNVDERHGFSPA